ncbi:MAG: hypothetical protein AAGH88_13870 [Planctomycetota bacterium]
MPKKIYADAPEWPVDSDGNRHVECTTNRQDAADTEYVRADIADAEIAELRERLAEAFNNSPTWPYVLAFAKRMEAKLAKNRHKGDRLGWLKDTPASLVRRIDDERIELLAEIRSGGIALDVMDEAADVANMAMMTADAYAPTILESAARAAAEKGNP